MEFNKEQAMSVIRWAVNTFGAGIAGFVAGKGWVDATTIMNLISNETFMGAAASIAVLIWGYVNKTKKNQVAAVAAMDEVKAVVLERKVITTEPALIDKTPENVVPAGTLQAETLAK